MSQSHSSFNYANIKSLAKEVGLKVTDLLALARQNDPFYVGTPADIEQAEWFANIWQRAGYSSGVHLRRVHYWTVSQDPPVKMPNGKPYENTDHCWKYLTQASKVARYLELVDIQAVVDRKNPQPTVYARYDGDDVSYNLEAFELKTPYIWTYGLSNANVQPYHLEVWCEKSTMDDVLKPVCSSFGANLVTFEGEASITSICKDLMRRIQEADKPVRIWYISDFDPAGNSMPVATARKIEWALSHYGLNYDVKLTPIALTLEQVQQYQLPRTPIKKSERRAAKFEEAFGTGAVELDALEALHPGELRKLVRAALAEYYSKDAAEEVYQQERKLKRAVREQVDEITSRYTAEIEALQAMLKELEQVDVDASKYAVERYEPHTDEPSDWLFDSSRAYLDQITSYKAHKGLLN